MDGMRSFCKRTGLNPSEALFLDIGSNLGTFSMAMAALGYRAIAFEAMPINQKAIKHSACANNFQSHLHVIESGVGRDQVDCQIYAVPNNAQNGIVSCNGVAPLAGCVKVDDIKVNTLDKLLGDSLRLLRGKVGVVKIDVEGFEPWVIDGGREFFSSASPAYIMTEINSGTLSKISNYTGMEYIRKVCLAFHHRPPERRYSFIPPPLPYCYSRSNL